LQVVVKDLETHELKEMNPSSLIELQISMGYQVCIDIKIQMTSVFFLNLK